MSATPSNEGAAPAREVATLGGGCFWCLEAVFQELRGVEKVESGYSGGHVADPTYRQVCGGDTGHAEVVQITFDPSVISYRDLLDVFFALHNPTTRNRQGFDFGTQYRSVIFYHSPEQQRVAEEVIAQGNATGAWGRPAVTQVVPFEKFYRAEDYHQNYFRDNPEQRYCRWTIAPKVAKLRQHFADRLRPG